MCASSRLGSMRLMSVLFRLVQLLFICVPFSLMARVCVNLVLLLHREPLHLPSGVLRAPVPPPLLLGRLLSGYALYSTLFCLSASIIFATKYVQFLSPGPTRDCATTATAFSCIAAVLYATEASWISALSAARSFRAPVRPALCLLYTTALVLWPLYQFSEKLGGQPQRSSDASCSDHLTSFVCIWDQRLTVTILTAINLLLYVADTAYLAREALVGTQAQPRGSR
ncbi:myeloid-associated differentiation marker-like [Phacochoerus africanus]|uniref:myeloid-associated differentiation marker-like n=1 Tax=Phacochoerus africanus TaxID=41426 RepID=UPI001FDAA856|nr:myeloid-associated differentiation marker-like [Phacochoerus africanus]